MKDNDQDTAGETVVNTGTINGNYGVLTLSADGSYTYRLYSPSQNKVASDAVNALTPASMPLHDVFEYTLTGGSKANLDIAIKGVDDISTPNDDPSNPNNNVNTITELATEDNSTLNGNPYVITGNVRSNDTDPDGPVENVATTGVFNGQYGILTMNTDGSYSYRLYSPTQNKAASDVVNALTPTSTPLHDVFEYTLTGGGKANLDIAIKGVDDISTPNDDPSDPNNNVNTITELATEDNSTLNGNPYVITGNVRQQ